MFFFNRLLERKPGCSRAYGRFYLGRSGSLCARRQSGNTCGGGIPDATKIIVVTLYDHGMSHGKQEFAYNGSSIIKKGALDGIEGPCPQFDPGRYKFKIEAVNADGVVIGVGSRERRFPEEK